MKAIKFKAKVADKWIYGYPIKCDGGYGFHEEGNYENGAISVDENTICQFVNNKDADGKDIYEGDIIESRNARRYLIKYEKSKFSFVAIPYEDEDFGPIEPLSDHFITVAHKIVIGNINDSKEPFKLNNK